MRGRPSSATESPALHTPIERRARRGVTTYPVARGRDDNLSHCSARYAVQLGACSYSATVKISGSPQEAAPLKSSAPFRRHNLAGIPRNGNRSGHRVSHAHGTAISTLLAARGHPRASAPATCSSPRATGISASIVVLEGAVEIVEHSSGERAPRARARARASSPATWTCSRDAGARDRARGAATGACSRSSTAELRALVDDIPELGEIIVKAFLMRRTMLLSQGFDGAKNHRLALLARARTCCATSRRETRSRFDSSISSRMPTRTQFSSSSTFPPRPTRRS